VSFPSDDVCRTTAPAGTPAPGRARPGPARPAPSRAHETSGGTEGRGVPSPDPDAERGPACLLSVFPERALYLSELLTERSTSPLTSPKSAHTFSWIQTRARPAPSAEWCL